MASFKENLNSPTDSRHLTQLIDNLTIDDQRMLARILDNWDDRDQRKQPRTMCSVITEYTVDNQLHKGTMKNISPGGAYIENRPLFPVSQEISQSFFIPSVVSEKIHWLGYLET